MKKYLIALVLIIIVLGAGFVGWQYWKQNKSTTPEPTPVACTMEAKLCPDGSAVGRQGPNCEFVSCPIVGKEGETVTGEFSMGLGDVALYGGPCFLVDTEFTQLLPRSSGDNRKPWFCFLNKEFVMKQFGLGKEFSNCSKIGGRAKIVIDLNSYEVLKQEIMGFDKVNLVKILESDNVVCQD